jgi:hypothetical protein
MFIKKHKASCKRKTPEVLKEDQEEESLHLNKKLNVRKMMSSDSKSVKEDALIQAQNLKRTYLQTKFITEKSPDEEKRNAKVARRYITPDDIKGNQAIIEIIKKERDMYKTPENLQFTKSYYNGNIVYEEEEFMKKKPPEETLEYYIK